MEKNNGTVAIRIRKSRNEQSPAAVYIQAPDGKTAEERTAKLARNIDLLCILRGEGEVKLSTEAISVKRGDIAVVNSATFHVVTSTQEI